ncbi:hypothetical protein ZWY2020_035706 [Hordeum vulgare]|nr:hypothetical protein ZWY2020_035706 [Hordeum vulgare]
MYVLVQLLDSPAYDERLWVLTGMDLKKRLGARKAGANCEHVGFGLDLLDPELQGIGWMICRGSFSVGKQRHRWNDGDPEGGWDWRQAMGQAGEVGGSCCGTRSTVKGIHRAFRSQRQSQPLVLA